MANESERAERIERAINEWQDAMARIAAFGELMVLAASGDDESLIAARDKIAALSPEERRAWKAAPGD